MTKMQWTMMFWCWCVVAQGPTEEVQFDQFVNQPGIYLEEIGRAFLTINNWKLVLHYNLTNYWQEWDHININMAQLADWCRRSNWHQHIVASSSQTGKTIANISDHTRPACEVLIQSIQHLLEGVKERNRLLNSPSRRRRAPLEFMGTLMSDLFGVMDQRDAEKYEGQIMALQSGTLQMRELIEKQVNVLDVTTNLVRKQHEQIMSQYKATQLDIISLHQHSDFVDIALQLIININTFKEVQEALIDVMVDLHQGHINTQLITPKQLKDQLENLKVWVPESVRVPDYQHHWIQLYKVLRVRARLVNNHIIFELSIPLMGQHTFQIYRVHPVPTRHGERMVYIQPTFKLVLVDLQRIWYYPMTLSELQQCQKWDETQLVCSQQSALHAVQADEQPCELTLLQHQSQREKTGKNCQVQTTSNKVVVIPLTQPNQWILSLSGRETFDVICKDTLKHITIHGSGILHLIPGCQIKNRNFLLQSQKFYSTAANVSFLPAFNLSQRLSDEETLVVMDSMESEMEKLSSMVKDLHAREDWTSVNLHDIHHYAFASVALILLAVLVVAWWRRRQMGNLLFQLRRNPSHHQCQATPPTTVCQRRVSC